MREIKQKEIEEMARVIDDRMLEARGYLGSMNRGEGHWIAEKLIEQGYRNCKDKVVLSKEELAERWIDLLVEFDEIGFEPTTLPPNDMSVEEYTAFYKDKLLMCLAHERKETAREFTEKLKRHFYNTLPNYTNISYEEFIKVNGICQDIDKLAKQYKVEIKE